jgi:hypothetical protein
MIKKNSNTSYVSSCVTFISTILLLVTLIFDYHISNDMICFLTRISKQIYVKVSYVRIYLAIKIAIFTIAPMPFTSNIFISLDEDEWGIIHIPLNSTFILFCLLRFWFFIKYYLVSCIFFQPRTQRICEINGFDSNLFFALKGMIQKRKANFIYIRFS